jgi:transcriptional regulator with XRE-family HTH domain
MRRSLKAARLAKGFSVAEIAKLAGVSPAVYYKWESGDRDPLIENARQISLILGKTIEELFFGETLDKTSINNTTESTGTEGR